jgi:phosphate transport system protein
MLKDDFLELQRIFADQSARVESMVSKAVRSLVEQNETLANEVIANDEPLCNQAEKDIESKAIEIMTLFAPKATDMRKLVSIIKANKDLERIGDQAVNIAEHALYLIPRKPVKPLIDIPRMGRIVETMINGSLEAFLQEHVEKAEAVLTNDDMVDGLNEQIIRELTTYMASDPSTIERSMRLIFITRNLERIGDLSMNLAEDVIYFITGKDIRHPLQRMENDNEKDSNN